MNFKKVYVCISITDKQALNQQALDNITYLLTLHRTKIWFMEKHETLTEAQTLFHTMYNPVKRYFDIYLEESMPSTYMACKVTMKYREHMHWELVHITSDLEVSCMKFKKFVAYSVSCKRLDLLAKLLNKVKRPFEKYCVRNCFWENKIKNKFNVQPKKISMHCMYPQYDDCIY